MNLATYWLMVPLVGIGLSAFGWLAIWMTRPTRTKAPGLAGNNR